MMHEAGLLTAFETMALDIFIRAYPIEMQDTRIVEIGDEDFDTIFDGQTPLKPQRLKQLIDTILSGEPKVLIVDLDTAKEQYQELKDIKREGTTIIWARKGLILPHDSDLVVSGAHAGAAGDRHAPNDEHGPNKVANTGTEHDGKDASEPEHPDRADLKEHAPEAHHEGGHGVLPLMRPLPVLGGAPNQYRDRSAMAVMTADLDGMVRSYRLRVKVLWDDVHHPTGEYSDTLPWAAVKAFVEKPPEERTEKALFNFTFTPDRSFSATQIEKFAKGTGWRGLAQDKIVILGGTYGGFDTHATPAGMYSGAHLIAMAIESHLQNRVTYPIDAISLALIDLAAGMVLVAFTKLFPYRWALLTAFGGSMIIAPVASVFLYSRLSMWFSFVPVLFGVNIHLFIDHFRDVRHMASELKTLEDENKMLKARLSGTPHSVQEEVPTLDTAPQEEPMPD